MADIYYFDGDDSILCAECAEASKDDFVEKFRARDEAYLNTGSTITCDECSEEIIGEEDEGTDEPERVSCCSDPSIRGGKCSTCGTWLSDMEEWN